MQIRKEMRVSKERAVLAIVCLYMAYYTVPEESTWKVLSKYHELKEYCGFSWSELS